MNIDKEKILVRKTKNGDIEAFDELVLANEKIIYNIIYRIMNNSEDTYDLSQETFIKAYTRINQFNEESKFSTWLYRIATNVCLDELRRRKGKEVYSIDQTIDGKDGDIVPQYVDEDENVEQRVMDKEKTKIIESALKELNENHRTILVLRDIQNLSYEEISETLEVTLGTVKSRISRARQGMKEILMQNKEPYASYFRQKRYKEGWHDL